MDVREFFHCSLKELSDSELFDIILDLAGNPASRFCVKLNKYDRRASRDQLLLMDIWDSLERIVYVLMQVNSKDTVAPPNEYPRPGVAKEKVETKTTKMTAEETAKFFENLVQKRDSSVTNEEIEERNKEFIKKTTKEAK